VKLLARLQSRLTTVSPPAALPVDNRERRRAPRYAVHRTIWLRRSRLLPASGSLLDISASGAAIRITIQNREDSALWPLHLTNGDEIQISGLLDDPVACWIVAVDEDRLRVRFSLDEPMRDLLRQAIQTWSLSTR
jgi:hypothetical protein